MFKFLHTADIHLDSPLLRLERFDDAPLDAFRSATRRAFDNIVRLAISERVRFVLIAGDLYDGECADFQTPLYFRKRMQQLHDAGIQVLIVQGNHDAANKARKAFRLRMPDNVHLFSTDQPETVRLDALRVAVHGQGFAQQVVEDDLSRNYPDPIPGWLNIGMLHTHCGSYDEHARYAPSTILGLTQKDYHYWALGHIHKPSRVAGPNPWIVYSGNPQGRHIGETGPRSCVVVSVKDGRIEDLKRHHVDVLRWYALSCSATDCHSIDEINRLALTRIQSLIDENRDMPLAVRIRVTGTTAAHYSLLRHPEHWKRKLREDVLAEFVGHIWPEQIVIETSPLPRREVDEESQLGELINGLSDESLTAACLAELRPDFDKLLSIMTDDPRLPFDPSEFLNHQLGRDAVELLTARLLEPEVE